MLAHRHMHQSFTLIPRDQVPSGQKILRTHWIYSNSVDPEGKRKLRARAVIDGNQDIKRPPEDVHSSVMRVETHRLLLILHINDEHPDAFYVNFDQSAAYLAAKLDAPCYVQQLPGYTVAGRETYICKVTKAWYIFVGLKKPFT